MNSKICRKYVPESKLDESKLDESKLDESKLDESNLTSNSIINILGILQYGKAKCKNSNGKFRQKYPREAEYPAWIHHSVRYRT